MPRQCPSFTREPTSEPRSARTSADSKSKQSIELVGLTADGALAPDSVLPPGLTTADLQPATLRQGLTVSGIYDGNRVYAAAAVNPSEGGSTGAAADAQ